MDLFCLKRHLLYQASYRGCRENEILIKSFVQKHIDSFDTAELKLLEDMLNLPDMTILDYIYKRNKDNSLKENHIFAKFLVEVAHLDS